MSPPLKKERLTSLLDFPAPRRLSHSRLSRIRLTISSEPIDIPKNKPKRSTHDKLDKVSDPLSVPNVTSVKFGFITPCHRSSTKPLTPTVLKRKAFAKKSTPIEPTSISVFHSLPLAPRPKRSEYNPPSVFLDFPVPKLPENIPLITDVHTIMRAVKLATQEHIIQESTHLAESKAVYIPSPPEDPPVSLLSLPDQISDFYDQFKLAGKVTDSFNFTVLCEMNRNAEYRTLLAKNKTTNKLSLLKAFKWTELTSNAYIFNLFVSEAEILKEPLPGVIQLLSMLYYEDEIALEFNYLAGGNLLQHLNRLKTFPMHYIRYFATSIVHTLSKLEKDFILYRDLRLENINLDKDGNVFLSNFSWAKKLHSSCTQELLPLSSSTAPEVILGKAYSHGVDVWGFGCCLYEMFVGHKPFTDQGELKNSQANFCKQVLTHDPLVDINWPDASIFDLLGKLLHKDRNKRIKMGEIKKHAFFASVPWATLLPPCRPCLQENSLDNSGLMLHEELRLEETEGDLWRVTKEIQTIQTPNPPLLKLPVPTSLHLRNVDWNNSSQVTHRPPESNCLYYIPGYVEEHHKKEVRMKRNQQQGAYKTWKPDCIIQYEKKMQRQMEKLEKAIPQVDKLEAILPPLKKRKKKKKRCKMSPKTKDRLAGEIIKPIEQCPVFVTKGIVEGVQKYIQNVHDFYSQSPEEMMQDIEKVKL